MELAGLLYIIVSKSIMVNSTEMESFQFGVILSWDVSTGHGLM